MSRIKITDNFEKITFKLSDGNPGAIIAICEVFKTSLEVDNIGSLGGFAPLMHLDSIGIYGTDIYVMYNDICERNAARMFTILRAYQLGYIDGEVIKDACSRQDFSGREMIDVPELYSALKEEISGFDPENKVCY